MKTGLYPDKEFFSETDFSVFPMLVEMGAMEAVPPELAGLWGRLPQPTPATPARLYVDDLAFVPDGKHRGADIGASGRAFRPAEREQARSG